MTTDRTGSPDTESLEVSVQPGAIVAVSAGINVLLATRRRAQLEGGSLRVLRASPRVRRLFELTRLDAVLMPEAVPYQAAS